MRTYPNRSICFLKIPVIFAIGALTLAANSVAALDFSTVPAKTVTLFYPGQASWEWAMSPSEHSGFKKFRLGKNCRKCHGGKERAMGDLIVSGKKLEPAPSTTKAGAIDAQVQFAQDATKIYFRISWPRQGAGESFEEGQSEVKVSLMLGDTNVPDAMHAGCWSACHDDIPGMASAAPQEVKSKYLSRSRITISRSGGGGATQPIAILRGQQKTGRFLEYWQADLNPGSPAIIEDGYILERQHSNRKKGFVTEVQGELKGDRWEVVISRPKQAGPPNRLVMKPDRSYVVGIAIHESHATGRHHYVSLEHTLSLGSGDADFVAVTR